MEAMGGRKDKTGECRSDRYSGARPPLPGLGDEAVP